MVRAKFTCVKKIPANLGSGPSDVEGFEIVLEPVTCGSDENETFYKYTPWGRIELGTVNVTAAERFEEGKEYYIDFSPA